MKRLVAQGLRAGFGGVVPSWLVGGLVFLLGVIRPSGAEATILPSFQDTEVDLLRGPPRPNYESTDRYLANAAAERHTLAALAGAPFVPRVVCDPSCRVASVGALGVGPLRVGHGRGGIRLELVLKPLSDFVLEAEEHLAEVGLETCAAPPARLISSMVMCPCCPA